MAKSPAWQRKEGKDPKGGLNRKGRASLRRQGRTSRDLYLLKKQSVRQKPQLDVEVFVSV